MCFRVTSLRRDAVGAVLNFQLCCFSYTSRIYYLEKLRKFEIFRDFLFIFENQKFSWNFIDIQRNSSFGNFTFKFKFYLFLKTLFLFRHFFLDNEKSINLQ